MLADNSIIISSSVTAAWPPRQEEDESSTANRKVSLPLLPQSQLQVHTVNTAPNIRRISYSSSYQPIVSFQEECFTAAKK